MLHRSERYILSACLLGLLSISQAHACSICLCGDDLFFYTGDRALLNHRLELTFQEQYMTKTSGPTGGHHDHDAAGATMAGIAHEDVDQVKLREHRLTLRGSYGVSRNITLFAKAPIVVRRLTSTSEGVDTHESSSGLGDIEISAIAATGIISRPNSSYDIALVLGVKTPSGRNEMEDAGERLDEHLQPGTGSWGGQAGAILSRTAMMYSAYASGYVRETAENDYEYKYGTAYLYNLGILYRASATWGLTAELNGRYASRDQLEGEDLHNTGGSVAYLTPGVRWLLTPLVNVIVNVRVPIVQDLNDDQDEGVVIVGEIGLRR
jgi:hypothetical protein